jgi:hypothetical protein
MKSPTPPRCVQTRATSRCGTIVAGGPLARVLRRDGADGKPAPSLSPRSRHVRVWLAARPAGRRRGHVAPAARPVMDGDQRAHRNAVAAAGGYPANLSGRQSVEPPHVWTLCGPEQATVRSGHLFLPSRTEPHVVIRPASWRSCPGRLDQFRSRRVPIPLGWRANASASPAVSLVAVAMTSAGCARYRASWTFPPLNSRPASWLVPAALFLME